MARVAGIRLGDPLDPDTGMGPINSAKALAHVVSFLNTLETAGARLMTGGARPRGGMFARGYWVEPTVYADVMPGMRIWREEIFGSIPAVGRWSDFETMIADVNDSDYGLSASLSINDITTALRTARRIRSRNIFINSSNAHYLGVPWGGFKNSGTERDEDASELLTYVETKVININI